MVIISYYYSSFYRFSVWDSRQLNFWSLNTCALTHRFIAITLYTLIVLCDWNIVLWACVWCYSIGCFGFLAAGDYYLVVLLPGAWCYCLIW